MHPLRTGMARMGEVYSITVGEGLRPKASGGWDTWEIFACKKEVIKPMCLMTSSLRVFPLVMFFLSLQQLRIYAIYSHICISYM